MKLLLLLMCVSVAHASRNIDLKVPLTPKMSYDCQTFDRVIVMRESFFDGVPIDGNIIFTYKVPEDVSWEDIKFRTSNGSLFITIPIVGELVSMWI